MKWVVLVAKWIAEIRQMLISNGLRLYPVLAILFVTSVTNWGQWHANQ